ncbi:hypothetical protein PRK78_000501 [Emydomyces testavorans]|uniref:Uncharacterized protein n=1 Tax=Emydomyces testavorans TaxID=2070801 RepID=A0AAF0DB70_9EURO|nr:hypothetical protein PRK78_000501 [Emydomyces testavorans]
MTTTPPPRGRLRTPPAPLHGSAYNAYSPSSGSPRRSKRIATINGIQNASLHAQTSLSSDESHIIKNTLTSLPASHNHLENTTQEITITAGMLPTPAKTPRKKTVPDSGAVARTLFTKPTQAMDSEQAPHKRARGKKYSGFSLESFHSDPQQANLDSIEIYTDVRDRIPTMNPSDDNPFISHLKEADTPNDDESDGKAKRRKLGKGSKERDSMVDEMINRDDGVLYVFRGKKIFRRFEPEDMDDSSSDPGLLDSMDDVPINRTRRLTRSSIKPRVLFPTAEQLRARAAKAKATKEASREVNEEKAEEENPAKSSEVATSDAIKTPITPPSKMTRIATPATPLASGRSLRSRTKKSESEITPNISGSPSGNRFSPFDRWTRTKAQSSPAAKGKKRSSSTLGRTHQSQSKKVHQSE